MGRLWRVSKQRWSEMNIYYLFLLKLFSICFFIGGCLSSSSYKSASVEEGKGIFGQALGITAIQYPNEQILKAA